MKLARNKMVVLTTRKSLGSKVKCLSRAEGGKECCHGDLTSASSWSISWNLSRQSAIMNSVLVWEWKDKENAQSINALCCANSIQLINGFGWIIEAVDVMT